MIEVVCLNGWDTSTCSVVHNVELLYIVSYEVLLPIVIIQVIQCTLTRIVVVLYLRDYYTMHPFCVPTHCPYKQNVPPGVVAVEQASTICSIMTRARLVITTNALLHGATSRTAAIIPRVRLICELSETSYPVV